jgi:FMN phosphatase YigB (HAD superfamily)
MNIPIISDPGAHATATIEESSMIKTIILDLGNVIVPLDFPAAYRAFAPRCGLAPAEIPKRLGATNLVPRLESGDLDPLGFYRQVSDLLGLSLNIEEFTAAWNTIFVKETFVPEPMLAALRERYRLLLLSNTNAIHIPFLRANYPLLRHFHHQILSHEVGALKPDAAIYQAALKHSVGAPEECFFTDDILKYVEGAREHGIQAEQFLGLEKLEIDLRSRGVTW